MADYNALEALINAYIKQNGVKAITGQVLNGVLRGMVSALGKGWTIAEGDARPDTDPGTMTGPVAYVAHTAGTYTNFGGLVVNEGEVALLKYNEQTWTKEVLASLAANATIDGNVGTPAVGVSFQNGVLTFDFRNMKGNPGDSAGFGTVNATVDGTIGTPGVSVQSSGPDTAKNFTFAFTGLKGEAGVTSVVASVDNTTGNPSCSVSLVGQELHLDFSGLKGAQGDTGVSADYPIAIVNNLTTNDPASALSAAQGVVLAGQVSQLEHKVDLIDGDVLAVCSIPNKYIKSDGTFGTTSGNPSVYYISDYIPVDNGDSFDFATTNLQSGYSYALYDSSKNIVGSAVGQGSFNGTIAINNGSVAYIVFAISLNGTSSLVKKLNVSISELVIKKNGETIASYNGQNQVEADFLVPDDDVKLLRGFVEELCNIGNKYIKDDGTFGTTAETPVKYFISPYISARKGNHFRFKTTIPGNSGCSFAVYDSAKNLLSAGQANAFNGIITITDVAAAYIVFSIHLDEEHFLYVSDSVAELYEYIPTVESNKETCDYIREAVDTKNLPDVFRFFVPDLEIYATGKYIDGNGVLSTLSGCNVYRFTVPYGVKMLNAVKGSSLGVYGCYELADGTFAPISVSQTLETRAYPGIISTQTIKYIYANYTSNGAGVAYIEFVYKPLFDTPLNNSVICGMSEVVAVNMKIDRETGAFIDENGVSLVKIPLRKGRRYSIRGHNSAAFFDGDGNRLANAPGVFMTYPEGAMYVLVGYKADTIVSYEYDSNTIVPYSTSVKKPLSFSGKSAIFFGDSICAGYASDESADIVNNWVKLFSDEIGLTYNNRGADSYLIAKVSGRGCIAERILSTSITEDFVFVAGGTNDAYYNVPIGNIADSTTATFFGALNTIADYLDTNYPDKKVIFVMPIGRTSGFSATSILTSLDEYRRAIYTVCAIRDYSVVNGGDFGFPGNSLLCSDGLHPTTIGHKLYAKCMLNALL